MKWLVYFYIWFEILFLLTGCTGRKAAKEDDPPTISVTIEPLRYFTEAIAGDKFKVISMVPKGSSPETYDPTPQQLVSLNKSEAYLRIGYIGFEQTWMDKLRANAPNMKVFDMSESIDLIHENEDAREAGEHTHEGGVEPHIWNSAENALIISQNIYDALCQLDSANSLYYAHRLDSLKEIIRQTDSQVRKLLQNADSAFMIYHPALSYYARDYGLLQIPIEKGGKEPSPTYLRHLIRQAREHGIKVIFIQPEFDMRNAQLIADETKTKIVPINPLNYDWQNEMINLSKALSHEQIN